MPRLTEFRSWLSDHWPAVRVALGLGALLILGAVAIPLIWGATPADKGVVAEWNETIARLGIDPVFPPEEDIYVGDVFAVITADNRADGKSARGEPLLNRAIKLTHIDMKPELTRIYENLPIFPDTAKRPVTPDEPWPQTAKADGVFTGGSKRGLLAIAAFPGFTIRHERAGSGGLSTVAGLFGASRQDSDIVEVKIPFAETYGVPSLLAAGKLARFCEDPFTRDVCSDETLRNHLSYVTPDVMAKAADPKTGRLRYLVEVEIALVNRVYLTRSIEQTRRLGRNQAALLQAAADAATQQKKADPPAPATGEPASPEPGASNASKPVRDLLEQLNTAVPGGVMSVTSGSDSHFELKQTFQRPIVIGYRAVRRSFPYDLDRLNLTTEQAGAASSGGPDQEKTRVSTTSNAAANVPAPPPQETASPQ
jgi:hypothetical protein